MFFEAILRGAMFFAAILGGAMFFAAIAVIIVALLSILLDL